MSWDRILLENVPPQTGLVPHITALFDQQRAHWKALRVGHAALSTIKAKTLTHNGASVIVQANAGRKYSVFANVDANSVAARRCFLCPQNLPAEERGIGWRDLIILPNPYPVLSHHCTIPGREHQPQSLSGRIGTMLELARAVGPQMVIFYNGPRSGASAPDHFHFQACDAEGIPILDEVVQFVQTSVRTCRSSFGRRMLVFASETADRIESGIREALDALRNLTASDIAVECVEPMINLLAVYREGRYESILFPRAAHRPACYFAEGAGHLAVSPASLEMAGVLVIAEPDQFDRIDAATARSIYDEVSLDESQFVELANAISM